jgi:hypothetical protein
LAQQKQKQQQQQQAAAVDGEGQEGNEPAVDAEGDDEQASDSGVELPLSPLCSHCRQSCPGPAGTSYRWRRHPDTRALLCGVCGRYADKHGGKLPPDTAMLLSRSQAMYGGGSGKRMGKRAAAAAVAAAAKPPASPEGFSGQPFSGKKRLGRRASIGDAALALQLAREGRPQTRRQKLAQSPVSADPQVEERQAAAAAEDTASQQAQRPLPGGRKRRRTQPGAASGQQHSPPAAKRSRRQREPSPEAERSSSRPPRPATAGKRGRRPAPADEEVAPEEHVGGRVQPDDDRRDGPDQPPAGKAGTKRRRLGQAGADTVKGKFGGPCRWLNAEHTGDSSA